MNQSNEQFFLDKKESDNSPNQEKSSANTSQQQFLKPRKKSYWWIWAIIIVAIIAGYSIYKYYNTTPTNPYVTEAAAAQNIKQSVDVTGNIEAAAEFNLNFKSAGTVQSVKVAVNDQVKKGQVLTSLDTTDLNSQLNQAQANVAVAQAQLKQVQEGTRSEEIAVQETNVDNAQTTLESAKTNYDLTKQNIDNDLSNAQTTITNNQKLLTDAETNLRNVEHQTSQNITNTIDSNLNQLNLTIIQENTIDKNFHDIWDNSQYYTKFKNIDWTSTITIDNLITQSERQKITFSNSYQQAMSSKTEGDNNQAINDALDYLNSNTQILNYLNQLLYSETVDVFFSPTELSTLRGRQTSNESSHNQNLSSVQNLTNTIASTKASNQLSIDNAKTQITNYQNQIQTAEENIAKINVNGQSQMQSAQDQITNAENQLKIQQKQLELKKAGPTSAAIAVAQAQVVSAQAQVNTIQAQISNYSIVAPVDGIITQVNVEVGEQSSSANPIIQMHSNADYEINSEIAETDIDKIKIGNKAIITFDAFTKDKRFTGTVVEIDPAATTIQGVIYYKTKVILDNQDNQVKTGMTANLEIITAEKENVLAVPNQAIKTNDQDEKYVDILTNQKTFSTESKTVTTGIRGNTHTEIITGLSGGEEVVILKK